MEHVVFDITEEVLKITNDILRKSKPMESFSFI